jgi:hypothetical protein
VSSEHAAGASKLDPRKSAQKFPNSNLKTFSSNLELWRISDQGSTIGSMFGTLNNGCLCSGALWGSFMDPSDDFLRAGGIRPEIRD